MKNKSNASRLCRINSAQEAGRQAKSEDRLGELLGMVADGLQDRDAHGRPREAVARVLLELVGIRVRIGVFESLRSQSDDITQEITFKVWQEFQPGRKTVTRRKFDAMRTRSKRKGYLSGMIRNLIKQQNRTRSKAAARCVRMPMEHDVEIEEFKELLRSVRSCDRRAILEYAETRETVISIDREIFQEGLQRGLARVASQGKLLDVKLARAIADYLEDEGILGVEVPSDPTAVRSKSGRRSRTVDRRESKGRKILREKMNRLGWEPSRSMDM